MKQLVLLLMGWIFLSTQSVWAQIKKDSEFTFFYISHDRQTNVQALTRELQQAYDNLKEYDNSGIFYLANGEEPLIVRVNMPNENEKDFPHLIGEMQEKLAHDISADYDVERILSIISESPITDDEDNLLYSSVNWNYYVTSTFWTMMYNESIISALYWAMDMKDLRAAQEFYMNILRSSDDVIEFEEGQAMGIKNYNGINEMIAIVSY